MADSGQRLNLGCGAFKKAGYLNLDARAEVQPEVVHDLEKFPYPLADNAFALVEADHVLEHLSRPFAVMKEIHRLLQPGGELVVRVPHFSRGFTHPEHQRGFDVTFPLYFSPNFQGGYTGVEFRLRSMRLRWFAQPYLKKTVLSGPAYRIGAALGAVFDFAANLRPDICSRLWCFWVGGFEEIEFRFQCVK